MANTATQQSITPSAPAARSSGLRGKAALPQYMFVRGGIYYFKRKVPEPANTWSRSRSSAVVSGRLMPS